MHPDEILANLNAFGSGSFDVDEDYAVTIFRTFNGVDHCYDLRAEALVAVRNNGNPNSLQFLKEVAEAQKNSHLGTWALEAIESCGTSIDLGFVLQIFGDPQTSTATQITATNVLANLVQRSRWTNSPLNEELRRKLEAAAFIALMHSDPSMRAYGCRLSHQLGSHREIVERLAKEDHELFWGDSTVADVANECL